MRNGADIWKRGWRVCCLLALVALIVAGCASRDGSDSENRTRSMFPETTAQGDVEGFTNQVAGTIERTTETTRSTGAAGSGPGSLTGSTTGGDSSRQLGFRHYVLIALGVLLVFWLGWALSRRRDRTVEVET